MRCALMPLGRDEWQFVWTLHHLVSGRLEHRRRPG
jgi:hypothetical protein